MINKYLTPAPHTCSTPISWSSINKIGDYLWPRVAGGTIIHSDNFHKRSVLKIESESNYTVSTGEDGVLIIADIREMKIVQKVVQNTIGFRTASVSTIFLIDPDSGIRDGHEFVRQANLDR